MIIQQNTKVKHKTLLSIVFASTFAAPLEEVQNCKNSDEQINPTYYDEEAAMQCDSNERQMEIFPVVKKAKYLFSCAIEPLKSLELEQALYFSIAHLVMYLISFIRNENFATQYYNWFHAVYSADKWCIYSLPAYATIFVLCLFRLVRNKDSALNYKVSNAVKDFFIVAFVGGVGFELDLLIGIVFGNTKNVDGIVSSDISGGVKIAQDKFTAIRIFTDFIKLYIIFAVVNNFLKIVVANLEAKIANLEAKIANLEAENANHENTADVRDEMIAKFKILLRALFEENEALTKRLEEAGEVKKVDNTSEAEGIVEEVQKTDIPELPNDLSSTSTATSPEIVDLTEQMAGR